jgi:hypothetical protein
MENGMLVSFIDELQKIAAGNVLKAVKPVVGGMGANIMAKPLPSPGLGKGTAAALTPKPAQPTNYTMVHSSTPTAAVDSGSAIKSGPPPQVT